MSRRVARENVYKLVFEFLFYNRKNETTLDLLLLDADLTDADREYMTAAYDGVIAKFDELKELVAKYSEGFSIDRIYKSDLAVLILCAYELKYMTDVPHAVSISEAVELANRYGGDKSRSFVNGVLATINKEIEGVV